MEWGSMILSSTFSSPAVESSTMNKVWSWYIIFCSYAKGAGVMYGDCLRSMMESALWEKLSTCCYDSLKSLQLSQIANQHALPILLIVIHPAHSSFGTMDGMYGPNSWHEHEARFPRFYYMHTVKLDVAKWRIETGWRNWVGQTSYKTDIT